MPELEGLTDERLLRAFAARRDEAAFAELVRRHAPPVWSVSRRILGRSADVEDVAQAAFLALARQAATGRTPPVVGAWLHRVAHDLAVNVLRARKAREKHEKETAAMAQRVSKPEGLSDEQGALLHAELNALPEKYRRALVLCHLEGKSLEQAGRLLGCPAATVGTWAARGREQLKDRLARRGLILSLALLASLLSAEAGAAELPATFAATTSKAAALFVAGRTGAGAGTVLSPRACALAEGAERTMFYARLRVAALVLVAVSLIGGGTGLAVYRAIGAEGTGPAVEPAPVAVRANATASAATARVTPEAAGAGVPALPGPAVTSKDKPPAPVSEDERKAVVEGNNAFAAELYAKLKEKGRGNLFFSPYSISTALAMTYAGARGETAAQMRKALRFTLEDARLHPAYAGTIEALNAGGQGNYELTVANSLWGEQTTKFQPEFLDLNRVCYGGGLNQVDFRGATEAARLTINKWVEDRTKEKIKDLIGPGGVTSETKLVLVNAVYFKGQWLVEFNKKRTQDAPFHLVGGQTANVPMMERTEKKNVPYLQGEGFQMVELKYKGDGVSMVVLLPEQADGLGALEAQFTMANLAKWIGSLHAQDVKVFLPKFKITWGTQDLGPKGNSTLPELGMADPFDDRKADFSGMDGVRPAAAGGLYITKVLHKAFVDVNEEGTEAAAATAVVMAPGAAPSRPTLFRADRPFVFLIRDTRSGGILFMGRVMDPR